MENNIPESPRLREALLQATWGHRVHPLHFPKPGGGCSCGKCGPSQWGKHPRLSGWQKQATTDDGIIRGWWQQWPDSNIGLSTGPGSDLLIVDVDMRDGKNGFRDLQELDPQGLGFEGLETPKVRTGSGGAQLYFLWPKGSKLSVNAGISGTAIDFRGIGGNAVAPGSTNDRGEYTWILSPDDCEKAECPGWLLTFLSSGKPPGPGESLILQVEADHEALETHPGCGEGQRNALLCRLVGAALASGVLPDEVMRQALAWNRRCNPPKPDAGIRKSVNNLIAKEWQALQQKAAGHPAPASPGIATLKPLPMAPEMILVTRKASEIKPRVLQWLWPNHIQLGAVNLIAGPEGKGKSLIAVDIAARTTTGSAWPDGSAAERGRVLYCSAEENIEAVVVPRLLVAGADTTRVEIVDGLGSPSEGGKVIADVDLSKCLPAVHRKLSEAGEPFRLVVWDTFQSCALTTDHKSNTEQKAIIQPLQNIAEELGVAMVCIEHHNRGGLGRGNPDSAILGGGLTRTARVIWHVIEDHDSPETKRLFLPGKMNNASKAADLSWRFTFADVERCIEGRQVILPRVEWLEPAGTSIQEAQERANGIGGGPSSQEASDEFHRACEWLTGFITEPRLQEDVKAGWKAEMLSERTIRRAKAHLCIDSEQRERKWYWMPPPEIRIGTEVITGPNATEQF